MRRPPQAAQPGATPRRLGGWLVLLIVLSTAWLGMRALQVRSSLEDARQGLAAAVTGLEDGKVDGLSAAQQDASDEVASAVGAVQDPLWRLAASVPVVGRTFAVTREAALVAEGVVDGMLPPLLRSGDELTGGTLLDAGRVDLALLARVTADVTRARTSALDAQVRAAEMPQGRVASPVADARRHRDARLAERGCPHGCPLGGPGGGPEVAVTVRVWGVKSVSPVTVHVRAPVVLQVRPPGLAVTR